MAKDKTVSYRVDPDLFDFLENWEQENGYNKSELSRENAKAVAEDDIHEDYMLKRLNGEVDSFEEYVSIYMDDEFESGGDEFVEAVDRVLGFRIAEELESDDQDEIEQFINEYKEKYPREGFLLKTIYGLTDD